MEIGNIFTKAADFFTKNPYHNHSDTQLLQKLAESTSSYDWCLTPRRQDNYTILEEVVERVKRDEEKHLNLVPIAKIAERHGLGAMLFDLRSALEKYRPLETVRTEKLKI